MDEDANVEIIKKKVDHFHKNKLPVHIRYKKGYWKRGYIVEVSADFFMLNEFLEGEFPVFFLEIIDVEMYNKKVGRGDVHGGI